jgi:hypothetical protein
MDYNLQKNQNAEQIFKACGENDRAEYGKKLLEYLSE